MEGASDAAKKPGFFKGLGQDIKKMAKKLDASMPKASATSSGGGMQGVSEAPWYSADGEPLPALTGSEPSRLVSQRLHRLPSRPIRPRVNSPGATHPAALGVGAAPTPAPGVPGGLGGLALPGLEDDGRQKLLITLAAYDLTERVVRGDGACQFRSLSDQLYGNEKHHDVVRERVVAQLRQHPKYYAGFVPHDYAQYCANMACATEWGDHVTLQAAADAFGLQIMVLTSYEQECVIKIEPKVKRSERVLWVAFWAEVHYNSISPA